jgi:hypothetical protein
VLIICREQSHRFVLEAHIAPYRQILTDRRCRVPSWITERVSLTIWFVIQPRDKGRRKDVS